MMNQKESILALLGREPLAEILEGIRGLPPGRLVSPLIRCLFHGDDRIRWHAVSALGEVVAALAETDMAAARTVVRRLLWSLNPESGNMGWGAPEALGEILARHGGLASEFAHLLLAHAHGDNDCYIEEPVLQRGLLWGLGRLAATRPGLLSARDPAACLLPFLDSPDPAVRGLAARVLGLLRIDAAREGLAALRDDPAGFLLYDAGGLVPTTVAALAREALSGLDT